VFGWFGDSRKQMASVTHVSVEVKYYGGISNFWREHVAYLKNMGIKYILKKIRHISDKY
jgi:hypothetical protein